jgi:hypothetical protein
MYNAADQEVMMDHQFLELLGPLEDKSPPVLASRIRITDERTAEVEIEGNRGTVNHKLKPMDQLFGAGLGANSIDTQDDRFHPLLMTIERAIVLYYEQNPALTDGQVSLALRSMGMNPAADVSGDWLARSIALDLRIFLSVNDWSKQEVKLAVRKVLQSVERHTKLAGVRGYLSFISEHLPNY